MVLQLIFRPCLVSMPHAGHAAWTFRNGQFPLAFPFPLNLKATHTCMSIKKKDHYYAKPNNPRLLL